MKDRLSTYPGRYTAVVDTENIEKGTPFNIQLSRDDEPTVEGTPYNKESVLPDSVAEAICPDVEDPTPADAFLALHTKKAPAGYGLGDTSSPLISWALTGKDRNGYVRSNNNSPDGDWWYGLNIKYDQTISAQLAFKRVFNNEPPIVAIRHRPSYGETNPWGEWEYVNPPMVEGVEYRTTERFNGKPVYAKYMDSAALKTPGSTNISVAEESVDIIGIKGYLTRDNDNGYFPLPYFYGGNACAYIYAGYATEAGNTTVNITTTDAITTIVSGSQYTAHVTVKYTKK